MPESKKPLAKVWMRVNGLWHYARVSAIPPAADQPVVVLVHGLGLSSQSMVPLGEELQATYRVYAPDLPGFGKSEHPDRVLGLSQLADALAAWMDAAGIGHAHLIGNSLGCNVIVDFAARHAERAASAVLIGPPVDRQARSALRQIARGCLDMLGEPLRFWPVLVGD